jgi:hypothetical protein
MLREHVMGRETDPAPIDGDQAVSQLEGTPPTFQSLKTKIRITSQEGRRSSRRASFVGATLVLVVLGVGAAALGAPMLLANPAGASQRPRLAVASESPWTTSLLRSAEPSDSAPDGLTTWTPAPVVPLPVVDGTAAVKVGGDPSWYENIKITYQQTVSAGQNGSLQVANLGRAQCEGVVVFATYNVNQVLSAKNYGDDPEILVYGVPETWSGTFDLQLTCFSDGLNFGYSHTWHMPLTLAPPLPWTISVTMSNGFFYNSGVPRNFDVYYAVDSHETSAWDQGPCIFTAKLSDGGTIQLLRGTTLTAAGTNLYWVGGKTGELELLILSDSASGQVTWNLTCTDLGGFGYGASVSASGTYDLSVAPTNPPTDTPAPTPPPTNPPTDTPPPTNPPTDTPAPTNPPTDAPPPATATPVPQAS